MTKQLTSQSVEEGRDAYGRGTQYVIDFPMTQFLKPSIWFGLWRWWITWVIVYALAHDFAVLYCSVACASGLLECDILFMWRGVWLVAMFCWQRLSDSVAKAVACLLGRRVFEPKHIENVMMYVHCWCYKRIVVMVGHDIGPYTLLSTVGNMAIWRWSTV